jgi:molybdenum cofactor cytidylyltransferase
MPKQLLTWREEPLVRHVVRLVIESGLHPVIVVTGYQHFRVEKSLSGYKVLCVYNSEWKIGQSTSIRTGLSMVNKSVEACLFFMSDQPQIPVDLVERIVKKYRKTHFPIIAPSVSGKRGNPVLFDRVTFHELINLHGDEGGRKLFDHSSIEYVQWNDASILLDVDTMDDYQKLKAIE